MTKRTDDVFLRRVIWLLLTLSVSSAGGWIWTIAFLQSNVEHNNDRIQRVEEVQIKLGKTMSSIDKGVIVLVTLAKERNEQQKEAMKKQNYIFGEQKRRSIAIAWVEKQMSK